MVSKTTQDRLTLLGLMAVVALAIALTGKVLDPFFSYDSNGNFLWLGKVMIYAVYVVEGIFGAVLLWAGLVHALKTAFPLEDPVPPRRTPSKGAVDVTGKTHGID